MLELKANDSRWSFVPSVFNEDGVGGCDQGSISFVRVSRIKGHAKHKTIWLNRMLINGSLVPNLVRCSVVNLAKVPVKRIEQRVKLRRVKY